VTCYFCVSERKGFECGKLDVVCVKCFFSVSVCEKMCLCVVKKMRMDRGKGSGLCTGEGVIYCELVKG
jgi:hypothetical protein